MEDLPFSNIYKEGLYFPVTTFKISLAGILFGVMGRLNLLLILKSMQDK